MKTCDIIRNAVGAKKCLSQLSSEQKNNALLAMALAIEEQAEQILAENAKDMEAAKGKISDVKLDRLLLTDSRIQGMADGIRDVVHLPDPVGRIITERTTADGLELKKISVPLGGNFKFSSLKGRIHLAVLSASLKTIVLPAVAVGAAILAGYRGVELGIIYILFSGPTAVSSYIMAKNMDSDHELAGQILLLSTLMCVFTIFMGVFALKYAGMI